MDTAWREEAANTITHGIGVLLSIAAFLLLIEHPANNEQFVRLVSFSIYGGTLVLLYLSSTLMHGIQREDWKKKLLTLDHAAIFLLIAGTNTPYMLVTLNGWIGWAMLIFVWALALIGIGLKLFHPAKFAKISTQFYLFMGWTILVVIGPLSERLPANGMLWLVAGGIFYTLGSIFYVLRTVPYQHAIWHLFVLAGSLSHFISIYYYV
ncbi:hemolysin III family protein [Paenibacillus sp. J2TS4]|uniref:PAQR family membrane homeostasis protein TrhA n=1 Tax=Paenibacillus sp. J2TS4 TaxID=2807194 RepID=UPI001B09E0B9|nr:hemolysin III family protein [Paenibacillus sp. J2TS4]GIP35411.1 hemolysin III [Paenibacillus sp. J2TS4]